ncbi:MAG: TetR/AcrR family transcriptional regulator [Gilvibacter sp.]
MPRKKEYDKALVTEKAMEQFWSKGYSDTSARMLEKSMGINPFSIYSSFGNKRGVLLESLKYYQSQVREQLLLPLSKAPKSIDSLQDFFVNFLNFTKGKDCYKGCLLINTAHETATTPDARVNAIIENFSTEIKTAFYEILKSDQSKTNELVERQTSYLFVALQGILSAAKINNEQQIDNYINMTFLNI